MRSSVRMAIVTVLAAGPVLLGGCAFTDRHVQLSYPPTATGAQRNVAAPTAAPDARHVVLLAFIDQRPQKDRVGEVRNGFGMHTADVLAENSVADWVTSATKLELERVGFKVSVLKARPEGSDDPVVSGEVLKVHCGAYFKYGGEVEISLRVDRGGRTVLQRTYLGKGSAGTNWTGTSKSYGLALSEALQSATQNFAAELQREISPTLTSGAGARL